ncbi:hypothetical protein ABFX02_09G106800 [Erythranthe guttata]
MGFMGQKGGESTVEQLEEPNSSKPTSPVKEEQLEDDRSTNNASDKISYGEEASEEVKKADVDTRSTEETDDGSRGETEDKVAADPNEAEVVSPLIPAEVSELSPVQVDQTESANNLQKDERSEEALPKLLQSAEGESTGHMGQVEDIASVPTKDHATGSPESMDELKEENKGEEAKKEKEEKEEKEEEEDEKKEKEETEEKEEEKEEKEEEVFPTQIPDVSSDSPNESRISDAPDTPHKTGDAEDSSKDNLPALQQIYLEASEEASNVVTHQDDTIGSPVELKQLSGDNSIVKEQHLGTTRNLSDIADSAAELDKVKKEIKMMETALQGAARQAQAKADEIAKLMNENEQLKGVIDDLRRNTNEAEIESLREEYHQRVAVIERKVYTLTKERDTLRREQNKRTDAAALLKEKDEIITQVMAEGEALSKKQAAQEAQMRKLRAQIRELEEEKKGLLTKLQVEENKVESLKRDKASTEKLLQETVENHQAEIATQKEYYTNALNAAKEAEALAEARANTEARTELESRLREAEERESMLVQTLEELRQTLSRKEQQAVFREDMFRKDIEDLQKRYQASERRCEELITQVPDSTRPLLRQIEAMQETAARRAEAWTAVERSLNSRLQGAEAKAAAAEEKERSINERLTQTLSRINVLEAQISCLRAEQTQLTRSLEKERQRAAENRQEFLALKEEADTQEGRVKQLEEEIKELKRKHKDELYEALTHQELLQQELEREKTARLEQERAARLQSPAQQDQSPIARQKSAALENGLARKLSSASSLGSLEESYFLQTTLDSSDMFSENRSLGEGTMSPYYMKSRTSNTFEAALRQKEGELASYITRLASLESIRDSLAEELVKLTAQCEKLRVEAATLPGIRAELDALRRRHSAALELMGERDEELEELRADIVDLKEMYREQVNLLVNKIQKLSTSIEAAR